MFIIYWTFPPSIGLWLLFTSSEVRQGSSEPKASCLNAVVFLQFSLFLYLATKAGGLSLPWRQVEQRSRYCIRIPSRVSSETNICKHL